MTPRNRRQRRIGQHAARLGMVASSVMIAITAVGLISGSRPAGASEFAGFAQIVEPVNKTALAQGTGETGFTLKLPDGAACTGDNATGGYVYTSFMVRGDVDLFQLQFDQVAGPNPPTLGQSFRQPLYEAGSGSTYVGQIPANADTPGGPGVIFAIGTFDLVSSNYTTAQMPAGTYTFGLACIKGPPSPTQLDRFWTATMEVATNGDAFSWTAIEQTGGGPTTTAGGSGGSTTTTKAGGSTTTTKPGSSTTSTTKVGGSTTSTALGGSTTTAAGATTTRAATTGGVSGSSGTGGLAATGSSPWGLAFWGAALVICGRMAVVLGRPPKVPTRA